MLGEFGPSGLELFRLRGGTFEALGMLTTRAYPVRRAAGCRRAVRLGQMPPLQMEDCVKIGRLATCQLYCRTTIREQKGP